MAVLLLPIQPLLRSMQERMDDPSVGWPPTGSSVGITSKSAELVVLSPLFSC